MADLDDKAQQHTLALANLVAEFRARGKEIDRLTAELEKDRADAARYRWLKSKPHVANQARTAVAIYWPPGEPYPQLDELIDELMRRELGEPKP